MEKLYYLSVSKLSHVEYCVKRSKIECFNRINVLKESANTQNAIREGNRLHEEYSYALTDFDRTIIRENLELRKVGKAFQRQINNVVVRGVYDDLKVTLIGDKKYVSLIEVKTTTKKYLWHRELKSAIRQLQLYMWMLKDYIEEMGYLLSDGIVEVYSQRNGDLLKRVTVSYDNNIEDWILDVIEQFNGTSKMSMPPKKYCLLCPREVRGRCDWNKIMTEKT